MLQNSNKGFETNVTTIRKKPCKFCVEPKIIITYKDPRSLKYFLNEHGKIMPRRISGVCAKHQRELSTAIKRARNLSLLSCTIKDF